MTSLSRRLLGVLLVGPKFKGYYTIFKIWLRLGEIIAEHHLMKLW